MKIAVIYGSTRKGNVELLTEHVIKDLNVEEIYLREHNIYPIVDQRHKEGGFDKIVDDYNALIDRILPCDVILFATPIYWFSMSATMKLFIDRWSQMMRDPDYPNFKEIMATKKAFVIAVGGDSPHMKGLPLIQQFQHIFDFIGMSFEGYLIGDANKPGDILKDSNALHAAKVMRIKLETLD